MQVTQVQDVALHLQHNPGGSGLTYNPGVPYQNTNSWPTYTAGAKLYNLGQMTSRLYRIDPVTKSGLQVSEDGGVTFIELVRDVVTIQAQYGVTATAAASDHTVTQWIDAAGAFANPSGTDYTRIKAIRLAIVARSSLREKTPVTTTATIPLWVNATTGQTTTAPIFTVPDQNYRYKVYETVVPLRNAIWGTS
jgi:type IV pilus assembly protein PilW